MENLNKEIPPALKVVVEKIKTLPCNFVIIYAKGVRNLTKDELDGKNFGMSLCVSEMVGRSVICVFKEPVGNNKNGDVVFFKNPHINEYNGDK